MGVGATLVASLMVGGRLWGLVSCHHYVPKTVPFPIRAACELLAEAVGTRIAALESFVQAQAELAVRRLEQRMIEAIGREGDWRGALFDQPQTLLQPLNANGAVLLFEGQVLSAGEVPGTAELRDLGAWLDPAAWPRGHRGVRGSARSPAPRSAPRSRASPPSPRRRRGAGHPGLGGAGRMADLVPAGTGADGDLGRRPLQAGDRRQRPDRAFPPPVLRPSGTKWWRAPRTLDPDRHRHRPADRRHGHRRGAAIPRRADADRARPAGAGAPPGRRRGPARGGGRCRGQVLLANAAFSRLLPADASLGGPAAGAWPTCCRISPTAPTSACGCATCCRTAAAGAAR